MLTLSIDTAGDRCAVALWSGTADDGSLAGARDHAMARGHGEAVFTLIRETMDEAGATPHDLTRIVAVSGPGTFTGLRIGLAAARGLALALSVPAVGVTSFELVAATDREASGENVMRLVAIDARRGELYVQRVGKDLVPAGEPAALAPADAVALLDPQVGAVVGTGAEMLADAARATGIEISWRAPGAPPAGLLARLGAGRDVEAHPPLPLYVRPPDAKPQTAPSLRAPVA